MCGMVIGMNDMRSGWRLKCSNLDIVILGIRNEILWPRLVSLLDI